LASGTKVSTSDNASGWWSGSSIELTNPLDQDLLGNTKSEDVFTGTTSTGTSSAFPLGNVPSGSAVQCGNLSFTTELWIVGPVNTTSDHFAMYGISQELTVPQPVSVPEPSTLWTAAVAMLAGIAYSRSLNRRELRIKGQKEPAVAAE
jgi:hypothetical protein